MKIKEITQNQLDLMISIVTHTPLFSVAIIPKNHIHYKTKAEHYCKVSKDIKYLESLGIVEDITDTDGDHQAVNAAAERISGYKYRLYIITELGIYMLQGMAEDLKKEEVYRNSIN